MRLRCWLVQEKKGLEIAANLLAEGIDIQTVSKVTGIEIADLQSLTDMTV